MRNLVGGLALAIALGATVLFLLVMVGSQSVNAALCPDGSYVSGSTCTLCPNGSYVGGGQCVLQPDGTYTGGYGGSPAPGPTFNTYPALGARAIDMIGVRQRAEARRAQQLQNQLLQQQMLQLRQQQRLLQQQQQQLQELRTRRATAPQPRAVPTDSEQQSIVAAVQQVLRDLGYYPGPSNGIADPQTRAAIRAFQADHDLAVTGEASVSLEFDLYQQRLQQ